MWEDLGISSGTGIIVLIILYFVIKWAVKNGINESVLGKHYMNNNPGQIDEDNEAHTQNIDK